MCAIISVFKTKVCFTFYFISAHQSNLLLYRVLQKFRFSHRSFTVNKEFDDYLIHPRGLGTVRYVNAALTCNYRKRNVNILPNIFHISSQLFQT